MAYEMARKTKKRLMKMNQNKLYFLFPVWNRHVAKIVAAYTLLKMLLSDPVLSRESRMSLIKLFLAGNTSGISKFPGIFRL
jgi:hypothetical protein